MNEKRQTVHQRKLYRWERRRINIKNQYNCQSGPSAQKRSRLAVKMGPEGADVGGIGVGGIGV